MAHLLSITGGGDRGEPIVPDQFTATAKTARRRL
jgi:hypothetical protein